ncbi:hypothetical protein CEXT_88861 [Caerostris extrusa]|uniref:Uncharacterized protein n=1 Tax=Caerostris extrusa TaxID=172846 RepID=A0AAV4XWL8_CAEEX|nr:hypothetical protein CEXT_88861 [Caerostris extrusa]
MFFKKLKYVLRVSLRTFKDQEMIQTALAVLNLGASRVIRAPLVLNVNHPRCHGSHDNRRRFELHPESFSSWELFDRSQNGKAPLWRECE